ncbi:hypothetical protein FGIG_05810 [Fasciola gigantica]|uniref:Coiled-coil domain-containing protein 153 n=2 Tax=Fasciola TaxID=6191 RepID=A0A4E0RGE6_FASHE|nr:hypothetical protein D915_003374 [Fasciola hepatica]TPP64092.1 hypothetical protein FGIG_05810 [Fasciola gigantica]
MSDRTESKRVRKRERRFDDNGEDVRMDVAQMKHLADSLTIRCAFSKIKNDDHQYARKIAERKASEAADALTALELDAKLSTSCVHTQYKMLQRLFLLRINESRDTLLRLTRELHAVRAESKEAISLRDRQLAERDARIEQLETHLKSMHYQMSGVFFDLLSRLEMSLEETMTEAKQSADQFHIKAKRDLLRFGLDGNLI